VAKRSWLIGGAIVLLVAAAFLGVVLFALGLLGVAEPPRYTPHDLHAEAQPSPRMAIGLIMIVLGSLLAYATHLISRE
jgi:hypothetical protein